jgi:hypothetical protein
MSYLPLNPSHLYHCLISIERTPRLQPSRTRNYSFIQLAWFQVRSTLHDDEEVRARGCTAPLPLQLLHALAPELHMSPAMSSLQAMSSLLHTYSSPIVTDSQGVSRPLLVPSLGGSFRIPSKGPSVFVLDEVATAAGSAWRSASTRATRWDLEKSPYKTLGMTAVLPVTCASESESTEGVTGRSRGAGRASWPGRRVEEMAVVHGWICGRRPRRFPRCSTMPPKYLFESGA